MEDVVKRLIEEAIAARGMAYAPYSDHPVGCAILADDGNIYTGCNVENAASPQGHCAEVLAVGKMVIGGCKTVKHVVVTGPGEKLCTPCGGCRQQLREFAPIGGAKVTVCDKDGNIMLETSTEELLPHSFGPDNVNGLGDASKSGGGSGA